MKKKNKSLAKDWEKVKKILPSLFATWAVITFVVYDFESFGVPNEFMYAVLRTAMASVLVVNLFFGNSVFICFMVISLAFVNGVTNGNRWHSTTYILVQVLIVSLAFRYIFESIKLKIWQTALVLILHLAIVYSIIRFGPLINNKYFNAPKPPQNPAHFKYVRGFFSFQFHLFDVRPLLM